MAATQTVPQHLQHCNLVPVLPRHGVITLFGYGIKVHVDRGHLTIQDGIGGDRRTARLPRVGHGIRRLVVIGSDGMVSLAAIRWLADQNVAFVMLDRLGEVLATTGPIHPTDARLRRAQSLADESGTGLRIALELIRQKLVAQERLVRDQYSECGLGRNDFKSASRFDESDFKRRDSPMRSARSSCILESLARIASDISKGRPATDTGTLANIWESDIAPYEVAPPRCKSAKCNAQLRLCNSGSRGSAGDL